jgi:hypothetical protein
MSSTQVAASSERRQPMSYAMRSSASSRAPSIVLPTCLNLDRERETHRRPIEIDDVSLEADAARLALAGAEQLARRFHLESDQWRLGRIFALRHAKGPADMDKVALDGCGGALRRPLRSRAVAIKPESARI